MWFPDFRTRKTELVDYSRCASLDSEKGGNTPKLANTLARLSLASGKGIHSFHESYRKRFGLAYKFVVTAVIYGKLHRANHQNTFRHRDSNGGSWYIFTARAPEVRPALVLCIVVLVAGLGRRLVSAARERFSSTRAVAPAQARPNTPAPLPAAIRQGVNGSSCHRLAVR